jgi:superfamily II DNA or RNA helicase
MEGPAIQRLTTAEPAGETAGSDPEALAVLCAEAGRHAIGVPAELLARQALRVTAGTDFTVARDALDALVRRAQAVERDELVIVRRPAKGAATGGYRVGRRRGERHYDVWFDASAPASGSCACRDFAKASLGLCKHLLCVARDTTRKRRGRVGDPVAAPVLAWDPIRPFVGADDWLARVWLRASGRVPAALDGLFARGPVRRLARVPTDVAARRALIETLRRWARKPGLAEPALGPLLDDELARLDRLAAGIPAREHARLLRGLKQTLFPYQREGVRRFLVEGRLLLADDMGLGKSAQAIAACHALAAAGRAARGLIVVPASLKAQWAREWARFTDLPVEIVDGNAAERARQYRQRAGFLLVNYEQVLRDLPLMQRFAPDVVVLDEAQRIKNWAAKTSAYVKRLDAPWRLVLTGTPMENRLEELASILEWVDETALEPRWRLTSWHAVRADGRRELTGARNLDTLRARLAPSMLRRLRTEVLQQLPSRCDTWVPVPLTAEQRAAHDELSLPIAQLVATARRRPLTQPQFLRLMSLLTQQRILCNGVAQRDFEEVWPALATERRVTDTSLARLGAPKLAELRERLAAIAVEQGRKVVVFSQWRRMLKLAAWATKDLLGDAGARAVFFTGEESQRRRTENLVAFHDDPTVRVLFATDAGGVGLNLQRAASCCIHLDLPWNPAVLEQRIGRVHRFGQTRAVDVYALVAEGGIEARIAGLIDDKKALFRGLFDGTSDAVEFAQAGSFLSRIERLLDRPEVPTLDDSDDSAGEVAADAEAPDGADAAIDPPLPAAAATAAAPTASASVAPVAPAVSLDSLGALFAGVAMRPLPDGRVSIEAPPAAAAALATLLRSVASMLEASGR